MLQLRILPVEYWDEARQEFVYTKEQKLQLEHSLVSLSKWESKWCKSFLSSKDLSLEQTIDYIRCMTITQNVDPEVYTRISSEHIKQVNDYISSPMTATVFNEERKGATNREVITAELVYYWMIKFNIPFECSKWHLNRLLTLIKVCNVKDNPPKKRSQKEIMSRNASLNAARRRNMNTRG